MKIVLILLLSLSAVFAEKGKIIKTDELRIGSANSNKMKTYEYISSDGKQNCIIIAYPRVEKINSHCYPIKKD